MIFVIFRDLGKKPTNWQHFHGAVASGDLENEGDGVDHRANRNTDLEGGRLRVNAVTILWCELVVELHSLGFCYGNVASFDILVQNSFHLTLIFQRFRECCHCMIFVP